MKVSVERSSIGVLEVWCDAPTWSDFKKIINHLKKEYRGRVLNKTEGPDARRWRLLIETNEITIDQCDWGSFPLVHFGKRKYW